MWTRFWRRIHCGTLLRPDHPQQQAYSFVRLTVSRLGKSLSCRNASLSSRRVVILLGDAPSIIQALQYHLRGRGSPDIGQQRERGSCQEQQHPTERTEWNFGSEASRTLVERQVSTRDRPKTAEHKYLPSERQRTSTDNQRSIKVQQVGLPRAAVQDQPSTEENRPRSAGNATWTTQDGILSERHRFYRICIAREAKHCDLFEKW